MQAYTICMKYPVSFYSFSLGTGFHISFATKCNLNTILRLLRDPERDKEKQMEGFRGCF